MKHKTYEIKNNHNNKKKKIITRFSSLPTVFRNNTGLKQENHATFAESPLF